LTVVLELVTLYYDKNGIMTTKTDDLYATSLSCKLFTFIFRHSLSTHRHEVNNILRLPKSHCSLSSTSTAQHHNQKQKNV